MNTRERDKFQMLKNKNCLSYFIYFQSQKVYTHTLYNKYHIQKHIIIISNVNKIRS